MSHLRSIHTKRKWERKRKVWCFVILFFFNLFRFYLLFRSLWTGLTLIESERKDDLEQQQRSKTNVVFAFAQPFRVSSQSTVAKAKLFIDVCPYSVCIDAKCKLILKVNKTSHNKKAFHYAAYRPLANYMWQVSCVGVGGGYSLPLGLVLTPVGVSTHPFLWTEWLTNTSENITFHSFRCGP